MRAFAGGFYRNLIRMYDYLGVKYREQPFLFSFTRLPKRQQSLSTTSCIPGPQMVYASNFHQIPPIPRTTNLIHWCVEAVYAVLCYLWFTFCCFFISPYAENLQTGQLSESLDHYLRRMWIPQYYVANYLLPLISSVCTCSHHELLNFPASDVIEYKRRTHLQQHFVVTAGVQCVQPKLLEGVELRLGVNLTHVIPQDNGVQIKYSTEDGKHTSEHFDLVVLAVSPDIAASLFPAVNSQLSAIPTTTVETVAHTDKSTIRPMLHATASPNTIKCAKESRGSYNLGTQRIHLLSNGS
jgi:predicted NAD/FAD-binding protein